MSANTDLRRYGELLLSEYRSWFNKLMMFLIFDPSDKSKIPPFSEDYFTQFYDVLEAEGRTVCCSTLLEDHQKLKQAKNNVLTIPEQKKSNTDIELQKICVNDFMECFQRFAQHVRKSLDATNDSIGIDSETGLAPAKYAERDYKREMERFVRDGQAFCVCLMRCDSIFQGDAKDDEGVFKEISSSVLANLRVFDDAYKVGENDIFISLKHTNVSGGVKFYERLRRYVEKKYNLDTDQYDVTACITEPVSGQEYTSVLEDLKRDLHDDCKDVRNDYVIMSETTDLQRFLDKEQ